MGARGNIISKDNNEQVVMYSHWMGSEIPSIIKTVLSRKERWNDYQYLNRMLFEEMIKNDIGSSTGFGISNQRYDGGADYVVDVGNQSVITDEGISYSFEEYINKG